MLSSSSPLQEVKDQSSTVLEGEEIRWVITVPAVWRQPAKQFMREAAYLVGSDADMHTAAQRKRKISICAVKNGGLLWLDTVGSVVIVLREGAYGGGHGKKLFP